MWSGTLLDLMVSGHDICAAKRCYLKNMLQFCLVSLSDSETNNDMGKKKAFVNIVFSKQVKLRICRMLRCPQMYLVHHR